MADLPHIEGILERQAKSWQLRHTLADADARERLLHLQEGPWLSVSRQQGSRGIEVAREVGRRMGWEVYDRTILATIAEHTHTREAVLAESDRKAVGPVRDFLSQLIVPGDPGRAAYIKALTRVTWGLARKGQAVFLGRGANWFLNAQFGLRVRIVAPLDQRIARIAESEGMGEAEARRRLLEIDHDRTAFVRQVFGHDIDDPLGYDLVLNVERMTLQNAADVILNALQLKLGNEQA